MESSLLVRNDGVMQAEEFQVYFAMVSRHIPLPLFTAVPATSLQDQVIVKPKAVLPNSPQRI